MSPTEARTGVSSGFPGDHSLTRPAQWRCPCLSGINSCSCAPFRVLQGISHIWELRVTELCCPSLWPQVSDDPKEDPMAQLGHSLIKGGRMKSRLHMAPDFQTPPTPRGWFCLHWDPINSWWTRSCRGKRRPQIFPRSPSQDKVGGPGHSPLPVDGHTSVQAQVDTHAGQEPHRHNGQGQLHNSKPVQRQWSEQGLPHQPPDHPPIMALHPTGFP